MIAAKPAIKLQNSKRQIPKKSQMANHFKCALWSLISWSLGF
jgi:hypothetical protein